MLTNCLQKIQVSQAQSNWFSFQEAATYKRQGQADLHTPDRNRYMSSTTATHVMV